MFRRPAQGRWGEESERSGGLTGKVEITRHFWQWAKHAWLYSAGCKGRAFVSSGFSTRGNLIFASGSGVARKQRKALAPALDRQTGSGVHVPSASVALVTKWWGADPPPSTPQPHTPTTTTTPCQQVERLMATPQPHHPDHHHHHYHPVSTGGTSDGCRDPPHLVSLPASLSRKSH